MSEHYIDTNNPYLGIPDIRNLFGLPSYSPYKRPLSIKKVIFNNPATIVIWSDDSKTVVKCQEGDTYSKELGLAMCISKKFLGNKGNFNEVFKKWIPAEEETPTKEETLTEDISVEEMRTALEKFCDSTECCNCVLTGREVCRCGWGTHFKTKSFDGSYHMTDDEIRDAYNRVFK